MKRRYESDINRIFSLIYEDEPIPPQVTPRTEIPVPEYIRPEKSLYPDRKSKRKSSAASYLTHARTGSFPETGKKALSAYAEKMEKKPEPIRLDLTMLEGIRKAAGHTMEKLLTEDDMDLSNSLERDRAIAESEQEARSGSRMDAGAEKEKAAGSGREENEQKTDSPFGLNGEETALLRALLNDRHIPDALLKGMILSVIVDSINEKLFDEFGDTVIENGALPELIEDYREDLEKLLSE